MPSIRVGYGSDFVVKNQRVGIGTEDPRATLEVRGGIKANFEISGVTTLTSYAGFIPQKQNIATKSTTIGVSTIGVGTFVESYETETEYESLVGEYNTLSDDLIVDDGKIFEIKTTSITGVTTIGTQSYDYDTSRVSLGTLESVSIQSHFTLPNGGIETRPENPIEGTVRFNDDLNTLEFYNGVEWRQFTVTGASGRALLFGGYSEPANAATLSIDVVTISTLGNATRFGEMESQNDSSFGIGNQTRGIYHRGPGSSNTLEYVSIASEGNPIDFGDLTQVRYLGARGNSSTRGIFLGGNNTPAGRSVTIDYVEMGTLGNALDFGDLNTGVFLNNNSVNSAVRVYSLGGYNSSNVNSSKIEYVTISSKGDALEFDDLDRPNSTFPGFANNVRGVYGGGNLRPTTTAQIYMFNTASQGKMIYFGELTQRRKELAGSCSQTRGVFAGGQLDPSGPTTVNVMDYVTIMSAGNATDFGDLSKTPRNFTSLSDSHGGLGGF